MKLEITVARLEDLPEIENLARRIWPVCYKDIITPEQIEFMLKKMYAENVMREELLERGVRFDLLRADDVNIGYVSYSASETDPKVLILHKIYILPGYQRRGLGSKLIDHVKKQAASFGCKRIILNVNKNNPALNAYLKNGFNIVESVCNDIGDGFFMDDYICETTIKLQL
ncbi:MAG: GNAT family N-acetyltransferase [Victivallales bacterium]|nr:GNAT family N-acetyltransferase [Victivallales bacterium]